MDIDFLAIDKGGQNMLNLTSRLLHTRRNFLISTLTACPQEPQEVVKYVEVPVGVIRNFEFNVTTNAGTVKTVTVIDTRNGATDTNLSDLGIISKLEAALDNDLTRGTRILIQ